MFCPVCHAEFIPGFTLCDECGVELVAELPAEPGRGTGRVHRPSRSADGAPDGRARSPSSRPLELVTAYRSGDSGMVALAKSLLMDAGIPFLDASPLLGRGGSIRVSLEDAADAAALLADLTAPSDESGSDSGERAGDEEQAPPASSPSERRDEQSPAGEASRSPGVTAPTAPTAPTPPAGVEPPSRRR